MKRGMSLAMAAVLTVAFAVVAAAGDYHTGLDLVCSDCHVMHGSQTHGYNSDGSGTFTDIGAGAPYEYLLRNEINDLCLTCHDGTNAPDVIGPNSGGYVRQAGALNRDGGGNEATGHTLDVTDVAPGSDPAWSDSTGLKCTDCHQPHGYGGPTANPYRNVSPFAGGGYHESVTYATGTNDSTADVYQEAAAPRGTHYAYSNIFFNEPDPTASGYAEWCKSCHTNFHGAKGGSELGGATGEEWLRHPTNDADIGAIGGGHSNLSTFASHTNRVQVMSGQEGWDDPASDNTLTPSCFSCHKAHGNENAFGLIYMSGTGTVTENGDDGTSARDLCTQCHVQGG